MTREKRHLDADGKANTQWLSMLLETYRDGQTEPETGEYVCNREARLLKREIVIKQTSDKADENEIYKTTVGERSLTDETSQRLNGDPVRLWPPEVCQSTGCSETPRS